MQRSVGAMMVVLEVALCSCGPAGSSSPATESKSVFQWQPAHGGGQYATASYSLRSNTVSYSREAGYRCWKARSGFDCIAVSRTDFGTATGARYDFDRFHAATLPATSEDAADLPEHWGYACSYSEQMGIFSESITTENHAELTSNTTGFGDGRPWTAGFVNGYLKANKVGGTRYFDCPRLANAIRSGSIATLGTTSITKAMLD